MTSFIRLIRFKNLLIITLTQVVIKFSLISPYLSNSALSNIDFCIYLFALIAIVAGGYIINDIYDIEIDKINKPEARIIEKKISKKFAFKAYYMLNLIGITSGFYAAYQVNKLWLGIIFIYFTISLWQYSKQHKISFIIGNLQVAFLTALSILNLVLLDIEEFSTLLMNLGWMIYSCLGQDTWGNFIREEYIEPISSPIILYIIIFYAGFSFITTLIREIIKDLEDAEGDTKIGANTLAIKFGMQRTKQIIILLNILPILGIAYFQYFQYSVLSSTFSIELSYWGVNYISAAYTVLLQVLLITLILKVSSSHTKADFHAASTLSKTIMIMGILSIPLFTYLHLY